VLFQIVLYCFLFLWPLDELVRWWGKLGWNGIQCIKSLFESNFGWESTRADDTLLLKFELQIDKSWSETIVRSFQKHLEGII